jgi:GH24 family phage-related lysozyme (muramidase)
MNDAAIDTEWAEICLTAAMLRIVAELRANLKLTPTVPQLAALLSLAYNVGVGARDGTKGDLADSTLIEKLNAGDAAGAADEFLRWNKARIGGVLKPLPGLTRRRVSERALFLKAT